MWPLGHGFGKHRSVCCFIWSGKFMRLGRGGVSAGNIHGSGQGKHEIRHRNHRTNALEPQNRTSRQELRYACASQVAFVLKYDLECQIPQYSNKQGSFATV